MSENPLEDDQAFSMWDHLPQSSLWMRTNSMDGRIQWPLCCWNLHLFGCSRCSIFEVDSSLQVEPVKIFAPVEFRERLSRMDQGKWYPIHSESLKRPHTHENSCPCCTIGVPVHIASILCYGRDSRI